MANKFFMADLARVAAAKVMFSLLSCRFNPTVTSPAIFEAKSKNEGP
jgi:hypothetical protein